MIGVVIVQMAGFFPAIAAFILCLNQTHLKLSQSFESENN